MSSKLIIVFIIVAVVLLGLFIIPVFNRQTFRNLPYDQQVRVLMKQAKGLNYFKNVSSGTSGTLYYVKNKRKILCFPWVLIEGRMLCTQEHPLQCWSYPEDHPALTEDEVELVTAQLEQYNTKHAVKLYLQNTES